MTFRVEVTTEAERDLAEIQDWLLSQRAGEAGLRWLAALEDAIASLAEFPARCAYAPENKVFPVELRHLLYGHRPDVYRIIFTIDQKTVYVLHVRHGRRQSVRQ